MFKMKFGRMDVITTVLATTLLLDITVVEACKYF